ncbi:MAG TPA: hypothetical protein VJB87_01310 [Candidatus Nanoarchaeia archaeon]|nr:hypothetical protein [Candidatus Nanoarchaeia archaeon]
MSFHTQHDFEESLKYHGIYVTHETGPAARYADPVGYVGVKNSVVPSDRAGKSLAKFLELDGSLPDAAERQLDRALVAALRRQLAGRAAHRDGRVATRLFHRR